MSTELMSDRLAACQTLAARCEQLACAGREEPRVGERSYREPATTASGGENGITRTLAKAGPQWGAALPCAG